MRRGNNAVQKNQQTGRVSKEAKSIHPGKAAVAGIGGGAYFAAKYPGSITIMGQQIPTWLLSGISLGLASVLEDLAHYYVLPQVHVSEKYRSPISAGIGLGAAIGTNHAVWWATLPDTAKARWIEFAAVAAGSVVAGHYVNETLLAPNNILQ